MYVVVVVLVIVVIGYIVVLWFQCKIDLFDLNMLKVFKGNLVVCMFEVDDVFFGWVYQEFNVMMDLIEKKMRLFQCLGEQEVIEKEQVFE